MHISIAQTETNSSVRIWKFSKHKFRSENKNKIRLKIPIDDDDGKKNYKSLVCVTIFFFTLVIFNVTDDSQKGHWSQFWSTSYK